MKIVRLTMVCLVAASVLVSGVAVIHAQDGGYTPTIQWARCPFAVPRGEVEGQTIQCGYLSVPQDRTQPDGRQVRLAFAVLSSPEGLSAPDPLIYFEGGPGGSALTGIGDWLESPFRDERDIVLLDQRGSGYSKPRLYCYELDQLTDNSPQAETDARLACESRLETDKGVDLSQYNSAANAADVADLRVALGYESWNLYGISYGTRLALTVMRDHPAGVRSVILDSTYPPIVDAYEQEVLNLNRVFRLMFDDCAASATCSAAYPDLENRFYALVARLDEQPEYVPGLDEELDGTGLILALDKLFADTRALPFLPLVIDEVEQGNYDALVALSEGNLPGQVDEYTDYYGEYGDYYGEYGDYYGDYYGGYGGYYGEYGGYYGEYGDYFGEYGEYGDYAATGGGAVDVSDTDGMFDSFECNEEIPFNSLDDALLLATTVPTPLADAGLSTFEDQIAVCADWNSGVADPVEDQAVTSDIPTLILAGQYDPLTPPDWGQIAAETLANSFFFEFPGVSHGVIDGGDCPVNVTLAFLDAPTTAPDAGCIQTMHAPDFVGP
jgi:pimeloyl-ACP methyl ester carboxylesterase